MNGYYFVLTVYASGRCSYTDKRYITKQGAERKAARMRKKSDVSSAFVCYQTGLTVDIKRFV